jgi:hypothetical protein
VASLVLLSLLAARSRAARRLLAVQVGAYLGCAIGFGAAATARRKESWRLLPRVVAVFPTFHIAYGVGVAHGFARLAARRGRK